MKREYSFQSIWKQARISLVTLVMAMQLPANLLAQQQNWEKEGGIPNAEIEIVQDRQLVLPPADRIFEKIPPRPAEPIRPEIVYEFKNLRFNTPDFNPALRPLKLKQEDISKIYGNFISAGYGNYSSPYLEAYFNTKRDKNKYYGAHFYHHSFVNGPVDNNNSGNGTTEINLFGKSILREMVWSGNLNFEDRSTFFYGYKPGSDPRRESIRQNYQDVSLGAGVENARAADFNYAVQGKFSYLSDHYKASESELSLSMNANYVITEKSKFLLVSDYYYMDYKDFFPGKWTRSLLRVNPSYQFTPLQKLSVTLGANIAVQNDTIQGTFKEVHAYPNFRADYQLIQGVSAYAGLTGDLDRVSFHTLTRENLWVNDNIALGNTNRVAEFYSGLKGRLGSKVAFAAGVSLSTLKNLYFFKNDTLNRARFNIVYDLGSTQRENLFAELGFHQGEAVKMVLRGDYFHYSTDRQPTAYHRPTYRLNFNSTYSLYNKLLFNLNFIAQGGMKAYDYDQSKTVTLHPALDLNVKVDYFFSKSVSVFLKFDNMLSNNYQLYLNYPVRGFQAMGGVSWSF